MCIPAKPPGRSRPGMSTGRILRPLENFLDCSSAPGSALLTHWSYVALYCAVSSCSQPHGRAQEKVSVPAAGKCLACLYSVSIGGDEPG